MQTENRLLADLARLASGAVGLVHGLRGEIRERLRARAESALERLDLVRREEFEAVKTMAARAREQNETLKSELDALRAHVAPRAAPAKAAKARRRKAA